MPNRPSVVQHGPAADLASAADARCIMVAAIRWHPQSAGGHELRTQQHVARIHAGGSAAKAKVPARAVAAVKGRAALAGVGLGLLAIQTTRDLLAPLQAADVAQSHNLARGWLLPIGGSRQRALEDTRALVSGDREGRGRRIVRQSSATKHRRSVKMITEE